MERDKHTDIHQHDALRGTLLLTERQKDRQTRWHGGAHERHLLVQTSRTREIHADPPLRQHGFPQINQVHPIVVHPQHQQRGVRAGYGVPGVAERAAGEEEPAYKGFVPECEVI